jgi:hypothetical protein
VLKITSAVNLPRAAPVPQPVCVHRRRIDHTACCRTAPPASRPTLYIYACAARPRPHRLEIRSPSPSPARRAERGALRAGRREVKKAPRLACHFKAESLRPTTPPRGPARPTQAAAPMARGGPPAATLAASPTAPDDSAGCRHGFRLASTASRGCTQRGPLQHRRSRPIDLSSESSRVYSSLSQQTD